MKPHTANAYFLGAEGKLRKKKTRDSAHHLRQKANAHCHMKHLPKLKSKRRNNGRQKMAPDPPPSSHMHPRITLVFSWLPTCHQQSLSYTALLATVEHAYHRRGVALDASPISGSHSAEHDIR